MGEIAARSSGGRPPPLHRGDDAACRAGPVCPAAGRHYRFFAGRWVPLRGAALPIFLRADCFHPVGRGLAPAAVPQHYLCGTFSIDRVSGHHASSLFTIPSYFDKRPPSATRDGVGTTALGLTPRGLRHLRMALWDDGGFRPVRGAGVSPAAAGGNFAPCEARPGALPPGPLQFFEKN